MVKIKDFFCKAAKVKDEIEGGILTFGYYGKCGNGQIDILEDYRLKMSGSYEIDEEVDEYKIKGTGNFEGELYYDQFDEVWYAIGKIDGTYKANEKIAMTYKFENDYHVFVGGHDIYDITVQTWCDSENEFCLYVYLEPNQFTFPSMSIRVK